MVRDLSEKSNEISKDSRPIIFDVDTLPVCLVFKSNLIISVKSGPTFCDILMPVTMVT